MVDLDIVEANIKAMAELARRHGKQLRPMIKTHKSREILGLQLAAGACGILAAKIGEVEALAPFGVRDAVLAYPIVGVEKVERVARLAADGVAITLSFDDADHASWLSGELQKRGLRLPALVIVDTGVRRIGVPAGQPAADLARHIAGLPGLEFAGFGTHAGHAYGLSGAAALAACAQNEAAGLRASKELTEAAGLTVRVVAAGSTPTAVYEAKQDVITELRPGNYVFHDANQLAVGSVTADHIALKVVATVISRPEAGRCVIDAGSKALSSDRGAHSSGLVKGYGLVEGYPDAVVDRVSEEVGVITMPPATPWRVGDEVTIIPNHACAVVNGWDRLTAVRGGRVVGDIEVTARGRVQ
jgi:D-serine deaminase-like pyridoxal phosphate-dependent protein